MKKTKKESINTKTKLLLNKCIRIYNSLSVKYDYTEKDKNKINRVIEFLKWYSSLKIKYNKILCNYDYNKVINTINNVYNKLNKGIEKEILIVLLEEIFMYLLGYTGCNLLVSNIKLINVSSKEIYYLFNSYSPVLNMFKITDETYILELYSNNVSKYLAYEYNDCILTTMYLAKEEELDTFNCIHIENKIENIVSINKMDYYINIYNNRSYHILNEIIRKCRYDKMLYDKNMVLEP